MVGEKLSQGVKVQLVHRNVRVVGAYTGAELPLLFAMWDKQEDKMLIEQNAI